MLCGQHDCKARGTAGMVRARHTAAWVRVLTAVETAVETGSWWLQGFGRGKDTHLSIFLKESQTLEEDVTFHFVFGVTSSSQDAFVKPMLNCVLSKTRKEYTGRQAFMPLDMIHNGGYIEPDGSLLIMIEIVELSSTDKDRRSSAKQ